MQMESASKCGEQLSSEKVNRLGSYSYSNLKKNQKASTNVDRNGSKKSINCYNCGVKVVGSIWNHKSKCPAKEHICTKCNKKGHYESVCGKYKSVKHVDIKPEADDGDDTADTDETTYSINIFRIQNSVKLPVPKRKSSLIGKDDFKIQVVVNNCLDRVVADTGARVTVCG